MVVDDFLLEAENFFSGFNGFHQMSMMTFSRFPSSSSLTTSRVSSAATELRPEVNSSSMMQWVEHFVVNLQVVGSKLANTHVYRMFPYAVTRGRLFGLTGSALDHTQHELVS